MHWHNVLYIENKLKFMLRFKTLFLLLLAIALSSKAQTVQELYQLSMDAKKSGNVKEYLTYSQQAIPLRPANTFLLNNVIEATLLNGKKELAIHYSKQLISGNIATTAVDSLLNSSLDQANLEELEDFAATYKTDIHESKLFKELKIAELHAEGLAFANGSWYITDIREPRILKYDPLADAWEVFYTYPDSSYTSFTGIKYSEQSKTIWACLTNFEQGARFKKENLGNSKAIEIDLKGKVLEELTLDENQMWGDLVLSKSGEVFITNSMAPEIYKYDQKKGNFAKLLDVPGAVSLQGIAIDGAESTLYFSDYSMGVGKIELSNLEISWLKLDRLVIGGVDGIFLKDDILFLAQNGTNPKRVSQVKIDEDELTDYQILEQGIFNDGEPTHFYPNKDQLYFIGNSPWPFYEEGKPLIDKWRPLQLRSLRLN